MSEAPTPDNLIAWADQIDSRLGPIPGRDADKLAVLLRGAATALAGIRHPTGSEQFQAQLDTFGVAAPWRLCDETVGEILGADGRVVLQIDCDGRTDEDASTIALWIIVAVNTCAGFKAVAPDVDDG